MADETKTPEELAAEKAAAEAKAAEDAAKATAGADEETKLELERTRIALKAANKEAADRRKRLEELEKADAERKQAEMTETDKLKAELETAKADVLKAEARATETLIRSAFIAEAAKANAAHPEDVYLLADKSAVTVDEAGKVDGVAEAVKVLIDAGRVPLSGKPPAPNLDGGAGSGERGNGKAVKLTAEEIETARKMNLSPERFAAQKAAIAEQQAV